MAQRYAPTDDEVNKAKDVLERAYRGWVNDLAEELIFEAFNEDIDDSDDMRDLIAERTDSGLVYTADQWVALYASPSTDDAWNELRDMGFSGTENPVGPWAVTAYQQDVGSAVWDSGLISPLQEGMDLGERIAWLIEGYSKKEIPLRSGVTAYLIGEVDDLGFGWLFVTRTDDEYEKHEFVGRYLEPDTLAVLMDLILEQGGDPHAPAVSAFLRKVR
jgi:hypothetical protein